MHTELEGDLLHPFDRSGVASLSDLETPEWRDLFSLMEQDQASFLQMESQFRSQEYAWPRDPLHTWSRLWEYPYAYYHLRNWRRKVPAGDLPRVVDLGSGVTFFPFSVARLGCHVTCTDTDPVAERDMARAAACVPHTPGRVDSRLSTGETVPFESGEADGAFCISVLEHIPGPEKTVFEIARILKPGGLLVLTIDLDLRGDWAIGVSQHRRLMRTLRQHFEYVCPDTTVHPADILDTGKGPYKIQCPTGLHRHWFLFREKVRELLGGKPYPLLSYLLAVQGLVLVRKTQPSG